MKKSSLLKGLVCYASALGCALGQVKAATVEDDSIAETASASKDEKNFNIPAAILASLFTEGIGAFGTKGGTMLMYRDSNAVDLNPLIQYCEIVANDVDGKSEEDLKKYLDDSESNSSQLTNLLKGNKEAEDAMKNLLIYLKIPSAVEKPKDAAATEKLNKDLMERFKKAFEEEKKNNDQLTEEKFAESFKGLPAGVTYKGLKALKDKINELLSKRGWKKSAWAALFTAPISIGAGAGAGFLL